MLSSGMNPHARIQSFSKLTNDPEMMIKGKFKKPTFAKTRFPPVLSTFSRTMAAPMLPNRQYQSVSRRIASNYNPTAR